MDVPLWMRGLPLSVWITEPLMHHVHQALHLHEVLPFVIVEITEIDLDLEPSANQFQDLRGRHQSSAKHGPRGRRGRFRRRWERHRERRIPAPVRHWLTPLE